MGGKLHPEDEKINRIIAMVRARVGHPFRVLKRQFGDVKTRDRGLAKNRAQLFTLFAPGNLLLVRRRRRAWGRVRPNSAKPPTRRAKTSRKGP
ncbi:hypothetical protein JMJ94_07540 [Rhodovulum visakhapatnamense]|uniref:DDE family transposase n=2 Tax=Rhodovulum visakhapatnamense TaxID=364297 RepID=A0ABS1RBQ6_9RHOB|nr:MULTISPECIES: transposase [Rhodovulum]MBL3569349.1 hypothetical protein [Rhodovulum visakhapatnamense]MBL3576705.1 hypothetical protein [Rhodovulum visakhapatnamense]